MEIDSWLQVLVMGGRVAERLLIVLASMLALWLGFRLFKVVTEAESSGALEFKGAKIQLQRIGPGVFFALFGSMLMGYALLSSAEITGISSTTGTSKSVSARYWNVPGSKDSAASIVSAVNTLSTITFLAQKGALSASDIERLQKAQAILSVVKNQALDDKFGTGTSREYNLIRKMCADASTECTEYLRSKDKEAWFTKVGEVANMELDQ